MRCLICKNRTQQFLDDKLEIKYWTCPDCGFVFKDPAHILGHEKERARYELHENSLDDPAYVAYFKKFLDQALVPFSGPGREALDFGSGPQPVLAQILERDYGYSCHIYDPYFAPCEGYKTKTFDVITATEVIEHLAQPLEAFEELASLLRPGGILAVMTQVLPETREDFLTWFYPRDPTHIRFFTIEALEVIGKRTGLDLVYTDSKSYHTFKKKSAGRL